MSISLLTEITSSTFCIIIFNKATYLGRKKMTDLAVASYFMSHLHLPIFRNILTKPVY